jgi:hypothetical protein
MLDWFANRWNDLVDYLYQLVLTIYDVLKDFFTWALDGVLAAGVFILDSVGSLLDGLDVAKYFTALPPETLYMLKITGFSEAMGMIVVCLGIRFTVQMIPFVRWGS